MSVVYEFDCSKIALQESTKTVIMLGIDGSHSNFKYDIDCVADLDIYRIRFFFNIKSLKMLIVRRSHSEHVKLCAHMKFWIEKDLPIPSTKYLLDQDKILTLIENEFKDKYAAIIIDEAINS